jgi:hypothetical protein
MLNDYKVIFPYEVYDKNWKGGYIEKYYPDCVFYFSCYQNGTKILDEIKMMNYSEVSIKDTGRCIYAILKK